MAMVSCPAPPAMQANRCGSKWYPKPVRLQRHKVLHHSEYLPMAHLKLSLILNCQCPKKSRTDGRITGGAPPCLSKFSETSQALFATHPSNPDLQGAAHVNRSSSKTPVKEPIIRQGALKAPIFLLSPFKECYLFVEACLRFQLLI